MLNIKKVFNLKIVSLALIGFFLLNSNVYCTELYVKQSLRVNLLSNIDEGRERLKNGLNNLTAQKVSGADVLARIREKFARKRSLLTSLGLSAMLLVTNAQPLIAATEDMLSSDRQSVQAGPVITDQIKEFQVAADQYNTPPKWKVYYADYGEKGSIDISSSKSIKARVHGEGNIIIQLIDLKRRSEGGNWQHGLSRVYGVKPGQEYVEINLSEFKDSDPSLDLTKINKVVVIVGQEAWGLTLNLTDPVLNVAGYEFSRSVLEKSAGIPISEHVNNIKKAQNERKLALLTLIQNEVGVSEEISILSKGLFWERIKTIDELKDKFLHGTREERSKALSILNYLLIDSSQNSNLRRYVYYVFKNVIKAEIQGEDLLEPYVKQGKVTQPIAVSFPVFWYIEKEGRELYEYPDWAGEIVTGRRLNDKGTIYGVEGVVTSKTDIERVLDRRTIKRLIYWALVMGVDPQLVNAISYTEALLGAHPEKFDGNILCIHNPDTYNALDARGKELRKTLLALYGAKTEDPKLDEFLVTGIILLADGFNIFKNSNDFAFRAQGHNGYGWNPFLKVDMSKNWIIGKRVKRAYEGIRGGELENIVYEVAKETGIEPSFLPPKLAGYKIDIQKHLNTGKTKPVVIQNKDNRTGL